jgi:hypothetical protein
VLASLPTDQRSVNFADKPVRRGRRCRFGSSDPNGHAPPPTPARVDSSTIKPFRLLYHSILHRVVLWPSSSEVLFNLRHMKIKLMQNMFTILHYTNILTNTLFHIDCYHIITPFLLSRRRYVFFPVPDPFILHGDLIFIVLQRLLLPHQFPFTIIKTTLRILHLFFYQDDITYNFQFQLHYTLDMLPYHYTISFIKTTLHIFSSSRSFYSTCRPYIHSFAATTDATSIPLYYYQDDFTYLTPFLLSRRHYVQFPVLVTL